MSENLQRIEEDFGNKWIFGKEGITIGGASLVNMIPGSTLKVTDLKDAKTRGYDLDLPDSHGTVGFTTDESGKHILEIAVQKDGATLGLTTSQGDNEFLIVKDGRTLPSHTGDRRRFVSEMAGLLFNEDERKEKMDALMQMVNAAEAEFGVQRKEAIKFIAGLTLTAALAACGIAPTTPEKVTPEPGLTPDYTQTVTAHATQQYENIVGTVVAAKDNWSELIENGMPEKVVNSAVNLDIFNQKDLKEFYSGTGTVVLVPDDSGTNLPIIITAYHVVEDLKTTDMAVSWYRPKTMPLPNDAGTLVTRVGWGYKKGVDITVLALSEDPNTFSGSPLSKFYEGVQVFELPNLDFDYQPLAGDKIYGVNFSAPVRYESLAHVVDGVGWQLDGDAPRVDGEGNWHLQGTQLEKGASGMALATAQAKLVGINTLGYGFSPSFQDEYGVDLTEIPGILPLSKLTKDEFLRMVKEAREGAKAKAP